jgi:hypothetical protein
LFLPVAKRFIVLGGDVAGLNKKEDKLREKKHFGMSDKLLKRSVYFTYRNVRQS